MSRTKTLKNNVEIAKALRTFESQSRFLNLQLVGSGHLTQVKVPELKKTVGSRGRMPKRFELTKAGENLVRLSKNWAAFKVAATETVAPLMITGPTTETIAA